MHLEQKKKSDREEARDDGNRKAVVNIELYKCHNPSTF
jgi:hypothetical protein